MATFDFSHLGNPFHWADEGGCWWFIQISVGTLVRFDPDMGVDVLDPNSGVMHPDERQWHSLSECRKETHDES